MHVLTGRRRRTRGQSVVEFAMVLPVLLTLLLISLDFGRLFMSYVTLTNATRVAANYGALNYTDFTVSPMDTASYDAMVKRETGGLNCALHAADGHTPPIPTYPNGTALNATSVVTMTCDFSPLTPFIGGLFPGGHVPLTASSEYPIRYGPIAATGATIPPPGAPLAFFVFTGVSGGTIDGSGDVSGTGSVTVNVQDSSANAQTWTWSWGDGTPDTPVPNPPAHTYSVPGTYTVTLTVANTLGTSTKTRTVTVAETTPQPVAGFYGTPLAGTAKYVAGGGVGGTAISGSLDLVVDFTNTSTNAAAYSWDFGDGGSPSTETSPEHTYTQLGIYTVVLTVTTPTGGTPQTRTNYVTTGCVVPNFANTSTADAQSTWASARFSGAITYHHVGDHGNGGKNPPSPAAQIVSQSIQGGQFTSPKKQGSNWVCNSDITLEYQ